MNKKTGKFDYAVAGFRLLPHVGVALGVVPYSNIGYSVAVCIAIPQEDSYQANRQNHYLRREGNDSDGECADNRLSA